MGTNKTGKRILFLSFLAMGLSFKQVNGILGALSGGAIVHDPGSGGENPILRTRKIHRRGIGSLSLQRFQIPYK